MASVIEIAKLLPLIIRLFPELLEAPILTGKVIPLINVHPESDTDLARNLNRKTRAKPQRGFKDSSHVIKISDAISCTSNSFNDTSLLVQLLLAMAKTVTGDVGSETAAQPLLDKMVACFRSKTLSQSTPRTDKRTILHGRPAKGHGKGRKKVRH